MNEKPKFPARLLPKALYRYLANRRIIRSGQAQAHANADAARQAVGKVDDEWRARIDDVLSCPDLARISKVPGAGGLRDGLVMMHNGIEVGALGYYGAGIMNMLMESGGVHEPQEEFVFGELLALLPPRPVMLEMGAYWSFYSLWLAKACPGARNFLIEPDYANLLSGQANFRRYGLSACFEQAYVSDKTGWTRDRVRRVTLDAFCERHQIERLTVLHADIQGAEVQMLSGARRMLGEQRSDYVFLSTHSNELHQECVGRLRAFGYTVAVSVDLDASFSFDGLIVAHRPGAPFPAGLQVSLKQARPSSSR